MTKRYDLLDMNNRLIWNFRDIGHTMRHISEGKGSQKRILIILSENGSITQRELTKRLGIQPGSASEVIGKLETAGMIMRTPSETDRRTTDIILTDDGKAVAEEAHARRMERHNQMFACLSDEEKDTLLTLLEKVNAAWDKQYRENDTEQRPSDKPKPRHGCRRIE